MERALRVMQEVSRALIGKNEVIGKVMLAILAQGHILLEDRPGVGKTTLALAFSRALMLDYKRVQFTPDVLPSDITGFRVYDKHSGGMRFSPGAAFCNLLLADEINRANTRTQAALLEAMEEGQITVDGETYALARPYTVIATQNPVGAQGTQLLPDSQLDRFMVKLSIGYPAPGDEVAMLKAQKGHDPLADVQQVADAAALCAMQRQVENIYIDEQIYGYIVRLVHATRNHALVEQGASPRASLALMRLGQSYAFLNGRDYLVPQDVRFVFPFAVAHRLLLSHQANAQGISAEDIAEEILAAVKAPGVGRCVS